MPTRSKGTVSEKDSDGQDRTIWERLREPFPEGEIKHRIQSYTKRKDAAGTYPAGTKGLKVAYIDARLVMDRLDNVLTPAGWSFTWDQAGNEAVKGRLFIGQLVREDVGYSNNPGSDGVANEPLKAAVSDALKRCAVHYGVGRHLYDIPLQYVSVDERGREVGGGAPPAPPAPRQAPPPPPPSPAPPEQPAKQAEGPVLARCESLLTGGKPCNSPIGVIVQKVPTKSGTVDLKGEDYIKKCRQFYGRVLCVRHGQQEAINLAGGAPAKKESAAPAPPVVHVEIPNGS